MLTARGIEKYYGELHVLKGVDITIQKGEILSIVGSSGAGKTTLLHILGTLDKADKGEIFSMTCGWTNSRESNWPNTEIEMQASFSSSTIFCRNSVHWKMFACRDGSPASQGLHWKKKPMNCSIDWGYSTGHPIVS